MFAEWVSRGAEIGIVAFTALIVFALLCVALYGLFMGATALMAPEDRDDKRSNVKNTHMRRY